jgi:hypothetical protein
MAMKPAIKSISACIADLPCPNDGRRYAPNRVAKQCVPREQSVTIDRSQRRMGTERRGARLLTGEAHAAVMRIGQA